MLCQLNISHRYKSSNFDSRKKKISFLIFHYTETDNLAKAIKLLTNKKKDIIINLRIMISFKKIFLNNI